MSGQRPPYVTFRTEPMEDRSKLISTGVYGFKDVVLADITVPGQRDTVTRVAEGWIADLDKKARDGMIPVDWPRHFKELLKFHIEGQAPPVDGSPILGWALLTPAQQKTVITAGIRSVEDLAASSDEALRRIGMGAILCKQKAQAWLEEAKKSGSLAEQVVTLARDNKIQAEVIEKLLRDVAQLKAQLPQPPLPQGMDSDSLVSNTLSAQLGPSTF